MLYISGGADLFGPTVALAEQAINIKHVFGIVGRRKKNCCYAISYSYRYLLKDTEVYSAE